MPFRRRCLCGARSLYEIPLLLRNDSKSVSRRMNGDQNAGFAQHPLVRPELRRRLRVARESRYGNLI